MGRLQFLVASIFSSPPKGTRCSQYVVTSMPNVCGSLCSNEGVVRFSSLGQSLTLVTHSEEKVIRVFPFSLNSFAPKIDSRPDLEKKKKKKRGGGKKKKKKKKKKK